MGDGSTLCNQRALTRSGPARRRRAGGRPPCVTPPVASGLLPGVFRQELLTRGRVEERVVRVDELARAPRIWLVNSLREWIDVELVAPDCVR